MFLSPQNGIRRSYFSAKLGWDESQPSPIICSDGPAAREGERSVKLPSVITSKIIFSQSFVWKAARGRVSEIFRQAEAEVGSPSDVRQQ